MFIYHRKWLHTIPYHLHEATKICSVTSWPQWRGIRGVQYWRSEARARPHAEGHARPVPRGGSRPSLTYNRLSLLPTQPQRHSLSLESGWSRSNVGFCPESSSSWSCGSARPSRVRLEASARWGRRLLPCIRVASPSAFPWCIWEGSTAASHVGAVCLKVIMRAVV